MRRNLSVLALAALSLLAFGAADVGATIFHRTEWDVSLSGKQTVKWSFSAEAPENCISYYGSASQTASGSGAMSMSFATKKKAPIWAETSFTRGKLRFLSFSTDGWKLPGTFTKHGKFSTVYGMPCGSSADDPAPIPTISDDSECGTQKAEFHPSLDWSSGELELQGHLSVYPGGCPGVFESAMKVDAEEPCTPKEEASGLDGTTLQELHVKVDGAEFTKDKPFTAEANHTFRCEFPSEWPGKPPLKVELSTRYEVDFKPRR